MRLILFLIFIITLPLNAQLAPQGDFIRFIRGEFNETPPELDFNDFTTIIINNYNINHVDYSVMIDFTAFTEYIRENLRARRNPLVRLWLPRINEEFVIAETLRHSGNNMFKQAVEWLSDNGQPPQAITAQIFRQTDTKPQLLTTLSYQNGQFTSF
ncbi:MAG: hypothetical protein FWE37_08900 [Spirochaetaceae bacterium]|nr:hypothetical protein [Spirochaetaceae bacterium]